MTEENKTQDPSKPTVPFFWDALGILGIVLTILMFIWMID